MKFIQNLIFSFALITLINCSSRNNEYVIENDHLKRTFEIEEGKLFTTEILNKVANKKSYTVIPDKRFGIIPGKNTYRIFSAPGNAQEF